MEREKGAFNRFCGLERGLGLWVPVIAGASFGLGLTVSLILRTRLDDWLGFAGTFVGAGFTIIASILLFEWRQQREQEASKDMLRSIFTDIRNLIVEHTDPPTDRQWEFDALAAQEALKGYAAELKAIRVATRPQSREMVTALVAADEVIRLFYRSRAKKPAELRSYCQYAQDLSELALACLK